jgi:DNA ligase-1
MKKEVIEKNWEGLMIRQDSFYKGKRTNDLLKVKLFHDEDYIVKKIISGPFRIIDEKDKIEKTITMLSSIIVELDEKHDVNVGSGFSLEERQKYNTDPSLIVGKKVTIKFFEKTETSLRFPIFKGVREEGC